MWCLLLVVERSEATKQSRLISAAKFLDCFASLAMTTFLLPLRQKAHHRVGEGVRLLDIGDVGGVEDGKARAGNPAADQFTGGNRGCRVVAAGDDERRA